MGNSWISKAIDALRQAGLRAERGFPAAAMPMPTAPVAAVNIHKITPEQTTLAVMVYSAAGGSVCEDAAQTAAQALTESGASCTVEACSFQGKAGLFCVRVLAEFIQAAAQMQSYTVELDGKAEFYLTGISAQQSVTVRRAQDEVTGGILTDRTDQGWTVTIEQLMPADWAPEEERGDLFTITIHRPGGIERYPGCCWQRITLTQAPEGVRRTRVAHTWYPRVVAQN